MTEKLKQEFIILFEEFKKKFGEFLRFEKLLRKFYKDTDSKTYLMLSFLNAYADSMEDRMNLDDIIITERDDKVGVFAGMLRNFVKNKYLIVQEDTDMLTDMQDIFSSVSKELQIHIGDKNTPAKYSIFEHEINKAIENFQTRTRDLKTGLTKLKKDYKKLLELYNSFIN
jgi:hypothetical protein